MPGPHEFPDHGDDRAMALDHAVVLYHDAYDGVAVNRDSAQLDSALVGTAERLFRFLTGPAFMRVDTGAVTDQATGDPVPDPLPRRTDPTGGQKIMQLRDDEQVTYSVTLASGRGNVIADQPGTQDDLSWTLEGESGVLELEVSEDTRSATVRALGPVGSGVLRVQVGDLYATEAIDVVAGDAALITLSAGEAVKQPTGEQPEEPGTPEV